MITKDGSFGAAGKERSRDVGAVDAVSHYMRLKTDEMFISPDRIRTGGEGSKRPTPRRANALTSKMMGNGPSERTSRIFRGRCSALLPLFHAAGATDSLAHAHPPPFIHLYRALGLDADGSAC